MIINTPMGRSQLRRGCSDCLWKIVRGEIFPSEEYRCMPVSSPKFSNDPALQALGAAIRSTRQQQKMSQEALADGAGVDRSYMSSIERGKQNPGVMLMVSIARALGVSVASLFLYANL